MARTQVKPDALVGFWQRKWEVLTLYFSRGLLLVVGLIAVFVAGYFVSNYLEGRKERATEKLGLAMRIATAPLLTDKADPKTALDPGESESAEVPRFKTADERMQGALKVLGELDKDFGSGPAALRANLVRAGFLYDQGKFAEAESLYRRLIDAKPKEQVVALLAQEGVGLCAEARGDWAMAAAAFSAQGAGDLWKERSQWNLARLEAKQGHKDKAIAIYKEMLGKGDPRSPLRQSVQNRLAELE